MLKRVLIIFAILLALLPAAVAAQAPAGDTTDDVLIRINGPVTVPAGDTAQTVVVIGDDAVIDGTVDYLFVINGDATIAGTVKRTVTIANGTVTLRDGARVEEDIQLYRADAVREAGATVVGDIRDEWGPGVNIGRGFWFGLWLSMTVAVVAAGLLFAAFGGRQLRGAAAAVTGQIGPTLLAALILWIVVPFLAVLAMVTVVGIPFGLGVLFFLMPALWFIGYLVGGAALGLAIVRWRTAGAGEHPYLPVLVGLVIFQLIAIVPFLGGTVAFVAGLIGGGALAYRAWTAFRGVTERPATAPPATAAPFA